MKLTDEQKLDIHQKLNYALKYRETFDEVYDHILQSIECLPGTYTDELFEQIVETEFGGFENLKYIESQSMSQAYKAMQKRHGQNMAWFFNWPTLAFTIALTTAGFFIDKNPATHKWLMSFTFVAAVSPVLFIWGKLGLTKYRAWQSGVYKKPSIKDRYINYAATLSCNVVNLFAYFTRDFDFYGVTTLLVFLAYSIYVMSFFRLYNQEYKPTIA